MTTTELLPARVNGQLATAAPPAETRPDTFRVSDIEIIARKIAQSRLFGMDEAQAFTLMLLAHSKGLHPIQAVERYHVFQGKPSMKADAMLAEFQSRGGVVEWHQHDHAKCDATFEAPGVKTPTRVFWTMEDAKKADLGGKDMWRKYPRQMLRARVISEGIRMTMPGILSGIYTPEEVVDFAPVQGDPERRGYPPPEHHAKDHPNDTGHGSGAYAAPASVAEYKGWLKDFVEDVNQKWLDAHTSEHGTPADGLKGELLRGFGVSGHLVKWGRLNGIINAPETPRAGQFDKFAAILWEREREAMLAEARAYGKREWRAEAAKMAAEAGGAPEEESQEDPNDGDPDVELPYEREPGEDG